jgi:DNA-binding transcriptional MerR regulator
MDETLLDLARLMARTRRSAARATAGFYRYVQDNDIDDLTVSKAWEEAGFSHDQIANMLEWLRKSDLSKAFLDL